MTKSYKDASTVMAQYRCAVGGGMGECGLHRQEQVGIEVVLLFLECPLPQARPGNMGEDRSSGILDST